MGQRGSVRAGDYTFVYRKGNENHLSGTEFFVHQRTVQAVQKVDFVSDRMPYVVLRGHWCNIIILHAHTSVNLNAFSSHFDPEDRKSCSSERSSARDLCTRYEHLKTELTSTNNHHEGLSLGRMKTVKMLLIDNRL
jgi:hypothetical protein